MRNQTQRAFALLEVIVAAALLAATAALVLQLLATVARDRALTTQRQAAQSACANAAERVQVLPWDELEKESLAQWKLSDEAQAALPGARLEFAVAEVEDPLPGRRVTVQVVWDSQASGASQSTQLVVWRYAAGEDAP